MIFISNIGNRDVVYNGEYLDRDKVRQIGEEIFNNYEKEKDKLTYPIIEPFMRVFADKLKNIYIFVTNQEDERVRDSDTLYLGHIIRKWISEIFRIRVNIVQYTNNPTNYEQVYNFFTSYFTQEGTIIKKADKRIISLSGGTPQMNGALYVILSSLYLEGNEFYSVFEDDLIPINHERTINKIFVKKSCIELLKIYHYQSIIELLEKNKIQDAEALISFLRYAHLRENFDFDNAQKHLEQSIKLLPSSIHKEYGIFDLKNLSEPFNLIRELLWNMEISSFNQNYLFFAALLFRLEEALLYEIIHYLFRDKISIDLNKKNTHPQFIDYLEAHESDIWTSLQTKKFKGIPLKVKNKELGRPVLFFIAKLKVVDMENDEKKQIGSILDFFDIINKYCYDELTAEQRIEKYNDKTSEECLGDLRNSSIIAHGFKPVSKEEIVRLYGESLERLILRLKDNLKKLLVIFLNDTKITLNNIFGEINKKIEKFILEL